MVLFLPVWWQIDEDPGVWHRGKRLTIKPHLDYRQIKGVKAQLYLFPRKLTGYLIDIAEDMHTAVLSTLRFSSQRKISVSSLMGTLFIVRLLAVALASGV